MTSRKNTHWCSTCRRGIRLLLEVSRGGVCSYCGNTSLERLYENVELSPFDFFGVSNEQNRPRNNNNRRLILENQSSFQELFNRFSAQNRRGPPPASLTVINSMPKVKIRKKHLGLDPSCPVCQDRFEVGVSVDNKEADKDLSSAHDINIEATKPTSRQRSYGEKKKCTMMTVPIHNQFDTLLSLPEGQDGFTAV
ncbi:probable E3 ubiquitin-protein ligase RHC1A [Brassica napus]|uniref:probable E3 ubiquitin-protein ligase RHC1A n=1 Tax=Brassica napus TaxID=3708 RepID=UPI0006AAB370|nr:probable E3 ubiquitin-protein ligase RHC1A [Brassica napus]